jgi:hypothetical protein
MQQVQAMKADNCNITIEGNKDGRPFKVTTTGSVEIKDVNERTREEELNDIIYHKWDEPYIKYPKYQLIADLTPTGPNGEVWRLEVGKIKVKKSATLASGEEAFYKAELSTTPYAKMVGVPPDTDWVTTYNRRNFSITISWKEEV